MAVPLVFVPYGGGTFVPPSTMPDVLRVLAGNQPVVLVAGAVWGRSPGLPLGNTARLAVGWWAGHRAVHRWAVPARIVRRRADGHIRADRGYAMGMRDFRDDDVRGAGPPVVWQGPEGAPVILVLDPAGEAKHETLPATWRDLAEHVRVGWCRLPAEVGEEPSVEDLLSGVRERVHLVAAATAAEPALRLAREYAGHVRSLVAVDPAPMPGRDEEPGEATGAWRSSAEWWDNATARRRQELRAHGVRVAAFISRETDPAMRVEPPVPLGHPDVVGRVMQLLLSFQGNRADAEPVEPERAEVAHAWEAVQKHFGPALERARKSGG